MSSTENKLRLDGQTYDLDKASEECRTLAIKLQQLEQVLAEKNNMIALLHRARNAYIADLKAEIIKNKTGVDLSSLFHEE